MSWTGVQSPQWPVESSLGLQSTSRQSLRFPYFELGRNLGLTSTHLGEKMEPTQRFTKTHEGKDKGKDGNLLGTVALGRA